MKLEITKEVQECIRRLGVAFKREAVRRALEIKYENITYRVSKALRIGRSTVTKVFNSDPSEAVQSIVKDIHKTNVRKNIAARSGRRKLYDDFDMQQIKRTVHQLFSRREYVSMSKLKAILSDANINCSLTTLRKYLHKLGFVYTRSHGKRFLKESDEIIAARHSYLRKIKQYRQDGWEIVYLDETWINTNHACTGEWTHNKSGPTGIILPACRHCSRHIPSGKGSRLIVLDAGSSNSGFIEGVGLIFTSKTNSSDYHDEMNGRHFLDWFQNTLIPALPNPSVVVMDNAPYHNIRTEDSYYPTTNTKKEDIVIWLRDRRIETNDNMLKCELLNLVRLNKPTIKYKTDEIAEANGHLVLRLPVKHCELNTIELIQAEEKLYVAVRNCTFKLKDVKDLFLQGKESITVEKWRKATQHVIEKVEEAFWTYDGVMEEEIPPFIIDLDDEDEDDFDSDEDFVDSENDVGPGGDATNGDAMDIDSDDDNGINNDSSGDNDDVAEINDKDNDDNDDDDDDDVLCRTCFRHNPTGRRRHIDWIFCDLCEGW